MAIEDYQAALNEANAQIVALSVRAQQFAIENAKLAREIARLTASRMEAEAP